MIWATVTILTPCSAENLSRSGTRAMVPSSFMTSQITPAGLRPASRARSTAASVWPARFNTPPGRALKGKMCPGITRSSGPVRSSTATRQVWALSAAEMPVDMPSFASMEAVKAVPMREWLCWTISGISSRSMISPAMGRQMRPRPYRAMKFMSSGVTSSAAIVRSPSFSRSSSSQTMTIFPALISSMISSIGLNGILHAPLWRLYTLVQPRQQQPLHVLADHIGLQVHLVTYREALQSRSLPSLGQYRDGKRPLSHRDESEADTIYTHAPFLDCISENARRCRKLPDLHAPGVTSAFRRDVYQLTNPVYVPLHYVSPKTPSRRHRPF